MRAVFVGAFCLLLVAIGLLLLAISLIPTDLGLTHLIGAYVFGAAGGLGLVIGFAGRAVLRSASATAATPMVASKAAVIPAATEAVSVPPEPESEPAPKIELPSSRTPAILAAGAAAGAAGLAAGAALGGFTRSEPREPIAPSNLADTALEPAGPADDRFLEELERDLFAEIRRPDLAAPAAVEAPAPTASLSSQGDSLDTDESVPQAGADEDDADKDILPPANLPQDRSPFGPDTMQATEMAADIGESAEDTSEPASLPPDADIAMEIASDPEPAIPPADPGEEPAMAADVDETPPGISGLIPDADSAALAEAVETLAPLETLDIVGSYDSGGTRFTMYSDGSVTAKGESVDRRFPSLDALRTFIDGGMKD